MLACLKNKHRIYCILKIEFQRFTVKKDITKSTLKEDLSIEVCSACHPFYTGEQKIVDTAGRVDKFRRRYGTKE